MLDHNVPAPAILTVHVASGGTRTYDADALDADAAWDAIPPLWLFCDYLPTRSNDELARDMQAGRKPLGMAGDEWARTMKGTD